MVNRDDSFESREVKTITKPSKIDTFGLNSIHSSDMIDIYKRVIDVRNLEMVYFKDRLASTMTEFDPFMKFGSIHKNKMREYILVYIVLKIGV
jgi:hypothetical protein